MTRNTASTLSIVAAAAAALALGACNRTDDRTAGEKLDSAVSTAKQKSESAMDTAATKTENATDKMGQKVDDAGITASVNAELARDPSLSALKINVDTSNGRVMLRGQAPDNAARDRATQLASNVKGVTSVENRLEVRG